MPRTSRFWSLLNVIILLATLIPAAPAASAPAAPPDPLAELTTATGGALRVGYHTVTGQVNFLATSPGRPWRATGLSAQAAPAARAETAARQFLGQYGGLFGLDAQSSLSVMRSVQRDDGRTFVRFQQQYQGVPIFGGELIVQLDPAQAVELVIGEAQPDLALATTPAVSAAEAVLTARLATANAHGVPLNTLNASAAALWVYVPGLTEPRADRTRLVWRVEVTPQALGPIRELVLVDAQRGSVALAFNQTDTVLTRNTYNANNTASLPGTLKCNTADTTCAGAAGEQHAIKAHLYAGDTYNYYFTTLNRNSIDDAGLTLVSTVHYSVNYDNAFWNGSQMVYGDKYGFPLADDVVAHELSHGVTQYESGLFYYYQSGAINEALSDVFGEFMDLNNFAGDDSSGVRWLLGEDITGVGAIRDMENPPAFSDPDKLTSGFYKTASGDLTNNASFDNGGVHTNSGVLNKFASLLTDGGTVGPITVTGLGLTRAAHIIYYAAVNLLTSGSDYGDLYTALQLACANLTGQFGIVAGDCQEVLDAANATEMNLQPIPNFNTDAPLCPGVETVVGNLFNDNLEPNAAHWTFSALTGPSRWSRDDGYAHSGVYALVGDDNPAATSDSVAAMNISIGLPAVSYLHFDHAYGFEGSGPDGGVVEYSTDGGGSWNDAAGLFQLNGYDGPINSGPLSGRNGFIGDSHGYLSSLLLLTALAGENVRFRFRLSLNSSGVDQGWGVDDVRIYTCSDTTPVLPVQLYLPIVQRNFGWQTIMREDFEGAWPTAGWARTDPGFEEYYWGQRNCRAATGSNSAWAMGAGSKGVDLPCGANYLNFGYSWMIYGPFSLADAAEAQLQLSYWLNALSGDGVCAMASINGTNFFQGAGGTCLSGNTGGVFNPAPFVFDLTNVATLGNLAGQPNVWIAVIFISNASGATAEGAYVDDLLLRKCSDSCAVTSADLAAAAGDQGFPLSLTTRDSLAPRQR